MNRSQFTGVLCSLLFVLSAFVFLRGHGKKEMQIKILDVRTEDGAWSSSVKSNEIRLQDWPEGLKGIFLVKVQNTSLEPLRSVEVKVSCGCLAVQSKPGQLNPGEVGYVTLRFDPSKTTSNLVSSEVVLLGDSQSILCRFKVAGNIVQNVTFDGQSGIVELRNGRCEVLVAGRISSGFSLSKIIAPSGWSVIAKTSQLNSFETVLIAPVSILTKQTLEDKIEVVLTKDNSPNILIPIMLSYERVPRILIQQVSALMLEATSGGYYGNLSIIAETPFVRHVTARSLTPGVTVEPISGDDTAWNKKWRIDFTNKQRESVLFKIQWKIDTLVGVINEVTTIEGMVL